MAERRTDAEDAEDTNSESESETLVMSSEIMDTEAAGEDIDIATREMKLPRIPRVIAQGTAILPSADPKGPGTVTAPMLQAPQKAAAPPKAAAPRAAWPQRTQQIQAAKAQGVEGTIPPVSAITHVELKKQPTLDLGGFKDRYEMRAVLGIGGMGEVQLSKDKLIGRDVALKVMHAGPDADEDARERFVREARIQGQLEHPSIVPVYDLGVDPQGGVFFTMKRVRGMTLQDVLDKIAEGDAETRQKFSRRKLLTALRTVCLAMDFAHLRGVIHRDLKPANIILGDFGEVYVLDWGLAKIMDGSDTPSPEAIELTVNALHKTADGLMLGTPGYMPPEQACGELEAVDARADIYSLGALLFEILCGEPLHPPHSLDSLIQSTLRGADARASMRGTRDSPPELDEVCVKATSQDPAERYTRARSISEAIESYLDGDRNVQLRRDLAKTHVAAAHEALARPAQGGEARRAAYAVALREIGSAIALDPSNGDALRTMAQLLTDVPDDAPPEAERELRATADVARREAARVGTNRFVLWNAFIPLLLWMGVRHLPSAVAAIGAVILCGVVAWWMSRKPVVTLAEGFWMLVLSSGAIGLMSMIFGPFILVPGQAATNTMFFAMNADKHARRIVVAMGVISIALPFFLDVTGIVPAAYSLTGGELRVLPRALEFPPVQTMLCLLLTSVAMVIIPGVVMGRMRDALNAAERRLFLQAWHLRQMVPVEARESMLPKPA